ALQDSGYAETIALAGLAKRLEELWLPDDDFPIILPRNSEGLYLLQRIRDEAHRFALKHQQKQRQRTLKSSLADIPGIGKDRQERLLKHFGSVKDIQKATSKDIAQVPGIGAKLAEVIVQYFAQDHSKTKS